MRCGAVQGVRGGGGARGGRVGVSRGPLPPGLPGEQSRPKEPSTRRAPRGPSATQPQAAGKGLGEGSGQSGGPATSGEMRGCLTTSPPGAPQKGRRGWLAGRSRADSHLAAPRVPAPPPLRPIRGPAPGSVPPPPAPAPGTWSPPGTPPRRQPRAPRPRRLRRPAARSGLTFV